jgi:hypothetical protein
MIEEDQRKSNKSNETNESDLQNLKSENCPTTSKSRSALALAVVCLLVTRSYQQPAASQQAHILTCFVDSSSQQQQQPAATAACTYGSTRITIIVPFKSSTQCSALREPYVRAYGSIRLRLLNGYHYSALRKPYIRAYGSIRLRLLNGYRLEVRIYTCVRISTADVLFN